MSTKAVTWMGFVLIGLYIAASFWPTAADWLSSHATPLGSLLVAWLTAIYVTLVLTQVRQMQTALRAEHGSWLHLSFETTSIAGQPERILPEAFEYAEKYRKSVLPNDAPALAELDEEAKPYAILRVENRSNQPVEALTLNIEMRPQGEIAGAAHRRKFPYAQSSLEGGGSFELALWPVHYMHLCRLAVSGVAKDRFGDYPIEGANNE